MLDLPLTHTAHGVQETMALGNSWASYFAPGDVIALKGDLGAGKTTFVKGLAGGWGGIHEREVQSPTFTYLHIHNSCKGPLYHFDLYRLGGVDDFLSLGFDDYLEGNGVCCLEWAERISSLLPAQYWLIELSYLSADARQITLSRQGHG